MVLGPKKEILKLILKPIQNLNHWFISDLIPKKYENFGKILGNFCHRILSADNWPGKRNFDFFR